MSETSEDTASTPVVQPVSVQNGRSFGLRERLLAIVLVIVVVAAGALMAFRTALNSVESAMDAIVGADVPLLNVAVQLSTQAQTVVGLVPALSRSGSDAAREGTRHRITQELNDIAGTLKQLEEHGAEKGRLQELNKFLNDIRANASQLDGIVVRRLKLESGITAALERLRQTRVGLRALSRGSGENARWQLAAFDALGAAAEAVQLPGPNELQKAVDDLARQAREVQQLARERGELAPAAARQLREVVEILTGPESPVKLRLELARLSYWQDTRLSVNTSLSDRFLRAAGQFGSETQTKVSSTAGALKAQMKRHQVVSFAAFGGILAVMIILIAYVSHFVVRRLLLIRDNIRAYLDNRHPPPIADSGKDEVGDIARALNFYVQLIAEREAALNGAKNEAERALLNLRKTQEELVQSEKLASLGSLVAGVAHELNTPIGNALVTASTLQDSAIHFKEAIIAGDVKKSSVKSFVDQSNEMSELITRSCKRAADLISSFKQVAVDQTSENRRRFELKEVVDDIIASLRPTFKKAPWVFEVDIPEKIDCDGFPGPLGQVLTNLINNAINHAFDGRDHGTIRITATGKDGEVHMLFSDDGNGMDSATLTRIFEPFFTTRLGKGGSGLGLSISRNIVTGMLGGNLQVTSLPGRGTTFALTFPATSPKLAPGQVHAMAA